MGAAPRHRQRPSRRTCPKCSLVKPETDFILLNDPATIERGYATRYWCELCLVERGHLTRQRAKRLRRAQEVDDPDRIADEERERIREGVREHQVVVSLLDRAEKDPTFARAVERAAAGIKLMDIT